MQKMKRETKKVLKKGKWEERNKMNGKWREDKKKQGKEKPNERKEERNKARRRWKVTKDVYRV